MIKAIDAVSKYIMLCVCVCDQFIWITLDWITIQDIFILCSNKFSAGID